MIVDEEVYLEHYGVKGMKWGVRNDRSGSGSDKSSTPKTSKRGTAGMDEGAMILAAYGAVFAAALLKRAHTIRADSGRKDAKKSGKTPFKENPELKKNMSVDQLHKKVVKPINKDYPGKGTKMNCRRCTMAYEMRRRGFDVKATKSEYASGQTQKGLQKMANLSKDAKPQSVWGQKRVAPIVEFNNANPQKRAEMVFDKISKEPNGSRGEVGVGWTMGGGHSMAYEVVRGKPVIFDTQNGTTYKTPKDFSKFTPTVYDAAITRLDNTKINDELVRRWATNV